MKLRRISKEGAWQVLAVSTDRGDCPLLDFLHRLSAETPSHVDGMLALLNRVGNHGPPRNVQLSHQLRGDIYEFIKGRIRILYFYGQRRIVVCTHGLVKKSQRMPSSEIELAEQALRNYRHAWNAGAIEILEEGDNDP